MVVGTATRATDTLEEPAIFVDAKINGRKPFIAGAVRPAIAISSN